MKKRFQKMLALVGIGGGKKWRQVTVVLTTGERQVWHKARFVRRMSPHEWTVIELQDGRIMFYPKRLVAWVGVGPRVDVSKTAIYG